MSVVGRLVMMGRRRFSELFISRFVFLFVVLFFFFFPFLYLYPPPPLFPFFFVIFLSKYLLPCFSLPIYFDIVNVELTNGNSWRPCLHEDDPLHY